MEKLAIDFHIQEYIALRAEMLHRINGLRENERNIVVGSFIVYGWLLARGVGDVVTQLGLWLPVMLAAVGSLRLASNGQRIWQLGKYLKNLEKYMADERIGGWEHTLDAEPADSGYWINAYRRTVARLYLIVTFAIAVFLTCFFQWGPTR